MEETGGIPTVDLHGDVHVHTFNEEDKLTCNNDSTRIERFPLRGYQSAQAMGNYLNLRLPERLIQDEYGNVTTMPQISLRHLPKLHAKMWRDWPQMGWKLMSYEPESVTGDEVLTADAVATVAKNLAADHVLVMRECPASLCSFVLCERIDQVLDMRYSRYKIALEPLVAWETLELVNDPDLFQREILIYRRTNNARFEPTFRFAQLIPNRSIAFCVECLRFIWNRRFESWHIMDEYNDIFQDYIRALNPQQETHEGEPNGGRIEETSDDEVMEHAENEEVMETVEDDGAMELAYDSWSEGSSDNASFKAVGGARSPYSEQSSDVDDRQTPFPLDGAGDLKRQRLITRFKIWEDPVTDENHSPPTMSFTAPSPSRLFMNNKSTSKITKPTHWTATEPRFHIRTRFTPPYQTLISKEGHFPHLHNEMDPTAGKPFQGTFSISEEGKYPNAHAGVPTGPRREYIYKPGIVITAPEMQDLGPIGVGNSAHLETSYQLGQYAAGSAKGKRPPKSKLTMVSLKILQVLKGPATAPLASRKPLLSPVIVGTERKALYKSRPATPRSSTTGKHGISIHPISAKPCPNTSPPPTKRFPAARQIICSCHKPAKTFNGKIVECYNLDCRVRWYHYDCLGKSGKLSSLHGKWTCDWCKAEKHWGAAKGVTDMKAAFSASEILDGLDRLGGITFTANPYGLGKTMELYGGQERRGLAADPADVADTGGAARVVEYDALTHIQQRGIDLPAMQSRVEDPNQAGGTRLGPQA